MKLKIREQLPIIEDIFGEREAVLGPNPQGYKNHVFRMINFCFGLGDFSSAEMEKISIAGSFHDLGIWTDKTFDYLPPSIFLSREYLSRINRSDWIAQVARMIGEHHKLRPFKSDALTEAFRKADLIDLSLGAIKFGLDANFVKDVKERFPNSGFRAVLIKTACRWFVRHPLNPIPVVKL